MSPKKVLGLITFFITGSYLLYNSFVRQGIFESLVILIIGFGFIAGLARHYRRLRE
ncbi:hypothetical protein [Natranaerobius thermophilus]|uniref:hypothetical protein n=1 Tax=Natranaerobius thermophilus TaxID=375929 RepID=UPI000302B95B|nr:hypothetical protein [Natranaerobius thermophilus]